MKIKEAYQRVALRLLSEEKVEVRAVLTKHWRMNFAVNPKLREEKKAA